MRAITSVPPPAGKPTMMWTGFLTTCACAAGTSRATTATPPPATIVRRVSIGATPGDGAMMRRCHRYQVWQSRESRRRYRRSCSLERSPGARLSVGRNSEAYCAVSSTIETLGPAPVSWRVAGLDQGILSDGILPSCLVAFLYGAPRQGLDCGCGITAFSSFIFLHPSVRDY